MTKARQPTTAFRNKVSVGQSYIYGWNRDGDCFGRKGEICEVEAIGAKNSVRVRFSDGARAITSANALRDCSTVSGSDQLSLF
jgi:hypothetical protein